MAGLRDFYAGKRVLLTGHTGFKGAWLSVCLADLGAEVFGYSLEPPSSPSLYEKLGLCDRMQGTESDVLHLEKLKRVVGEFDPELVFHFAAQTIVRESYRDPVGTFDVNLMGTVNLMEALRVGSKPRTAVLVTSDKCYENREWEYGYRETDTLGGWDPYSASKALAEIAVTSYRRSFLAAEGIRVATARAGNVIGGGDYAADRIVPDIVRSLEQGVPIAVRSPDSIRPWQHVLEALYGYLLLASRLALASGDDVDRLSDAMNFGPSDSATRTVRQLVEVALKSWPGEWQDVSDPTSPHEAGTLRLVSDKAISLLGWQRHWGFEETVHETMDWYCRVHQGANPYETTLEQWRRFQQVTGS